MPYARDYSVIQVKALLTESERWGGHGKSLHHDISDRDSVRLHKSAFVNFADTNAVTSVRENVGSRRRPIWRSRDVGLYTATKSDQPFRVAQVLNSAVGQAALGLLDRYARSRIVIHAWSMKMGMGMPEMTMRVPSGNRVVQSGIGRIVMVIEGGYAQLHVVTAYPTVNTTYNFKFGPANLTRPQSLPGVEHTFNNGAVRKLWQWSTHDQQHGTLVHKWGR